MKKTFEVGMYVPDAKTREVKQVMLEYAKEKGVTISNMANHEGERGDFILLFDKWEELDTYPEDIEFEGVKNTPITIAQFFEYCDNWNECKIDPDWIPVSVKPESYVDLIVRVQTNEGFKSWCGSYFFGRFGYYTPGRGFIESDDITHYQHLPKP